MKISILILLLTAGQGVLCLAQSVNYWDASPNTPSFQIWLIEHDWKIEEWKLTSTKQEGDFTHETYVQVHNEIHVLGAEIKCHYKNQKIYLIHGQAVKDLTLNTTDATTLHHKSKSDHDAVILSVLIDEQFSIGQMAERSYHLNDKMQSSKDAKRIYTQQYNDVQTGEQLFSIIHSKHTNTPGKAVTRFSDTVDIVTDFHEGIYRLQENRNNTKIRTLNAKNSTVEELTDNFNVAPQFDTLQHFKDEDNFWNNNNAQIDEIAGDIHWGTEVTFDYYLAQHNHRSIDGEGGEIISIAHLGEDWDEAFFLPPPFNFMGYGDGGPLGPNVTLDVIAHEMTHGVVHHTAGLIYIGESSVLDEGFADIFSTAVKLYKPNPNIDPWKLAEQLGTFRSLSDPKSLGQPDTYLGENWYTGDNRPQFAHQNNGVLNYWFYLLTEGGEGINDNEDNYMVEGIGINKAETIAFKTLSNYLTPLAKLLDARVGSLQAATDLFGLNSFEYLQVKAAWEAVGVVENIVGITDDVSLNSSLQVFPIPTTNYINLISNQENVTLHFYNAMGKLIKTMGLTATNYSLDISEWPTGLYTLEIITAHQRSIKKIIKQ
ncbi:MAG: M4 family metallopeptidase [Bacteroidota bacterium]